MDESYQGPRLEGDLTPAFMKELLEWQKREKKLHRKYAYKVLVVTPLYVCTLQLDIILFNFHSDRTISAGDYEESAYISGCVNT